MEKPTEQRADERGADSVQRPCSASHASYHDVVCIYGHKRIRIADDYAFELRCTRAGGWSLWHVWHGGAQKLAAEYDEPRLQIEVKGVRIL